MNFAEVKSITIPEGAVVRILSGDTVLWEKDTGGLPSEYQQVAYVETDGNQYIDTGVMASDHADGIRYVFSGNATGYIQSKGHNYLFGCLNDGKRSGNVTVNTSLPSSPLCVFIGAADNAIKQGAFVGTGVDFTVTLQATSTASIDGIVCTLNDTTLPNTSATFTSCAMPNASIYLLWCRGVGATSKPFMGKLYAFTMDTADGTPIRNFVPCYRKADDVIGLYDTVGGAFYTNAGTGSFAKGADV